MKILLIEALDEFQKKYVDERLGGNEYNPHEAHKELFDSYVNKTHPHRIFYNLDKKTYYPSEPLTKHLYKNGWEIKNGDYEFGLASKKIVTGKGFEKVVKKSIGKILHDTSASKFLINDYNKSRTNANSGLSLVISRDKEDIAGMSTNRHWQSCMTLPTSYDDIKSGVRHNKIANDFKHHTMVAYVVKNGDNDIENPIGRFNIKKYVNGRHEIYRANDTSYGQVHQDAIDKVNRILRTHYPSMNGLNYKSPSDLYNENQYEIENLGLIKSDDVTVHRNENNDLHDYIDDKGIQQPARHEKYQNGDETIYHYKDGNIHRDGDTPAMIVKHNGLVIGEFYYKNGIRHRDGDLPQSHYTDQDGTRSVEYVKYNMLHREGDKPAIVHTDSNGNVVKESYYKYGLLHRDNNENPCMIEKNGSIIRHEFVKHPKGIESIVYHQNGTDIEYHSSNKISSISYDKNNKFKEAIDNKLNKYDYDDDGNPRIQIGYNLVKKGNEVYMSDEDYNFHKLNEAPDYVKDYIKNYSNNLANHLDLSNEHNFIINEYNKFRDSIK